MLLARTTVSATPNPLRGVFGRDDAWLATGDLFRRDADGDYWLVDGAAVIIRGPGNPIPARPISDALGDLPSIDLAVAYPVEVDGAPAAGAAVTLRSGRELEAGDVDAAFADLPVSERPAFVRVVDEIPVTTWFRPSPPDSARMDCLPRSPAGRCSSRAATAPTRRSRQPLTRLAASSRRRGERAPVAFPRRRFERWLAPRAPPG